MNRRSARNLAAGLLATMAALAAAVPATADAAVPPVSHVRVADHFGIAAGQMPEAVVLDRHGSVDLSFSKARQIVRVDRDGTIHVLATLPAPADGGIHTPALGFPLVTGLVKDDDGTLYFLYTTGTGDLTGLWRLTPGGTAERITALPATGLPNGLSLDRRTHQLYATDSVLGTIWRIPTTGGPATVWAGGPELAATGFLGANGIKVHNGAVWATNFDQGTVLRYPIADGGRAGTPQTMATGLAGIDDFDFLGHTDRIVAALNPGNEVALVEPDGTHTVVLTAQDGLSNPTSIAVHGDTLYVPSAAYLTGNDPNLLTAHINPSH